MSKDHYITISPDIDYYYQDEEGMCSGSSDDVIENYEWDLQPRFNIIIPGIAEWCERYVRATQPKDTSARRARNAPTSRIYSPWRTYSWPRTKNSI